MILTAATVATRAARRRILVVARSKQTTSFARRRLASSRVLASLDNSDPESSSFWKVIGVATGLILATATARSTALLEESKPKEPTSPDRGEESVIPTPTKDEKVEEDPYDNLPEEDEDTDCVMCNTFRQGPCRPHWRKLERCFKDFTDKEGGATNCMKYFTPHQQCLMQYTNLYQLVSLDLKQEIVKEAEQAVSKHERAKFKEGDVELDWSIWHKFVADPEGGLEFSQVSDNNSAIPLWKKFPINTEPVLLTLSCHLPRTKKQTKDEKELILKMAYAMDQNDKVLGFAFNNQYGDLLKLAHQKPEDNKEGDSTKNEEGPVVETAKHEEAPIASTQETAIVATSNSSEESESSLFEMEWFAIPGDTEKVRIAAFYAENPVTAPPDKTILDVLLVKSKVYSMKKHANQ